jgi:hypothetical protein
MALFCRMGYLLTGDGYPDQRSKTARVDDPYALTGNAFMQNHSFLL